MHRERSNALYPMDFKIEAVLLLRESGKSLKEVAEDLGVSTPMPCVSGRSAWRPTRLECGEATNLKVVVPDRQYRALRVQAALTDKNMSELVSMAIEEWLERHPVEGF